MITSIDVGFGHAVQVHELGDRSSGPTIAVLGGVHGDELEGVTACRLLLDGVDPALLNGRLRVVPVANRPAFEAGTRTSPLDGLNLARQFPGSPTGSVTERIADALTSQVLAGADLLIDLHSAGENYEMPVFAGFVADRKTGVRSEAAARAFGAPMLWRHERSNPGRSISAASAAGIPSLYVEGSGGGGLRGEDLDVYVNGLWRVMAALGMLSAAAIQWTQPPAQPLVLCGDNGDVDESLTTREAGFCITRVRPGDVVTEGDCLAEIVNDEGARVDVVRTPRAATVMMLRRRARVSPGDGIAMLGPVPQQHELRPVIDYSTSAARPR